jgi:hypothetical protein
VINLAADKDRVLAEAFRVLKPGGRIAVSDILVRGTMPRAVRKSMELWVGCVAGALEGREYQQKLTDAGFVDIDIKPTRVYSTEDACGLLKNADLDQDVLTEEVAGTFMSAFVRARKPAAC